jgi:2-polyprenyl-3-methyl-5-hydroxy-6-metoxy-1,4-benzoquinol methylase
LRAQDRFFFVTLKGGTVPAGTIGSTNNSPLEQNVVNEHFAEAAPYWRDIYRQEDVYSRIHQQRNALVLVLVEQLRLPAGSRILDVGCGAGLTTVALAQRGYRLDALDTVPAMLELTRQKAQQAEVSDRVSAGLGDAHQLPYPDESFHVVIAMGVTPFLHSLPVAMREMTRVVTANGYVLVNADNCWRLNYVLDPRLSPLLAAPRRGLKMLLRPEGYQSRPAGVLIHRYSRREFDSIIAQSSLQIRHSSMLGFGPFTFFGKELPNRIGLKLHGFLQECADQNVPILRSTGSQYIVLAQKLTPPLSFSQEPRPSL